MQLSGKALCLGDHIDTDAIIPARFLVTFDPKELGENCMSGYDPEWVKKVTPGASIIVAGKNFGCGSSREHAPVAIVGAGINVVLAHSFARIFYRNSFNMGLLPLEIGDDYTKIREGDELVIDSDKGTITNKTTGDTITFTPLLPTMKEILDKNGLAAYVKARLQN